MAEWITEKQLEQGRVQAEKIYKEFLEDTYPLEGEQTWDEIEIDGQYFDIECWDDDMENPRTETFCAIYPTYLINDWRETDSEKWIRLFTNEEKS
mgnify:FL=1|tara:strand:+ start:269 stop:553 length:285 start_codon:yes stop_codon:yes gene_type:complete